LEVVGARENREHEGDTPGEREHLSERPMKIVSAHFLKVWNFPIG